MYDDNQDALVLHEQLQAKMGFQRSDNKADEERQEELSTSWDVLSSNGRRIRRFVSDPQPGMICMESGGHQASEPRGDDQSRPSNGHGNGG
jgi:hypothetical protein